MGRALYSQLYIPAIIREPSPSPYEKWSISKPFDPDSEEFFEGAQYEAFLQAPTSTSANSTNELPNSPLRMHITTTRTTTTRDSDFVRPPRVRISNEDPTSIVSTARSNPDIVLPTMSLSPPPMPIPDYHEGAPADGDLSRPAPSPMAVDSDAEDPMRILAGFMNRRRDGDGDEEVHLNVSDILRRLDEQWGTELRSQEDSHRPQRYLPPLSYPSSSSSSSSSRADSPSSPIFFPSPPSETRPSPPPMSRQYAQSGFELDSEPSQGLAFLFDEELAEPQVEPSNLILRYFERIEESLPADSDTGPADSSIPHTSPLAVHPARISNSFGFEVGMDMSPPPSVSPRLYTWRAGSDLRLRHDSVSGSPARRVEQSSVRGGVPIASRGL